MAGFVYIIQASSGHIKIGKANNVQGRLATLRTASPFPLKIISTLHCEDPLAIESMLHKRFASKRTHGEWFFVNPKELECLSNIQAYMEAEDEPEDFEAATVMAADMTEYILELEMPLWGEL